MADALALTKWEENGLVKAQQKLADFITYFQSMADTNNDGMPMSLIDPTVIAECVPYAANTDEVPEDKYYQAIVSVDFEDGVPCVGGLPIWERLDGEAIPYYKIFKEYRDMKYVNDTNLNTRSIARLAEQINASGKLLSILSKIYHWPVRVKAYDAQKSIEIQLKKQRVVEELENKHSKYSNDILEQAINYLNKNVSKIDPKIALQMIELGMKYGRISVGLLGDKPGTQAHMSQGGVHQTNIAISQTNSHNEAGQMLNVNNVGGDNQGRGGQNGSAVERRLGSNMKDQSQLMSVLHVLNASGAFKAAALPETGIDKEDDEETKYDMYDDGTDLADIIEIIPEDYHNNANGGNGHNGGNYNNNAPASNINNNRVVPGSAGGQHE